MGDQEIIDSIKSLLDDNDSLTAFSDERLENCDKNDDGLISTSELEKCLLEMSEEMKTV